MELRPKAVFRSFDSKWTPWSPSAGGVGLAKLTPPTLAHLPHGGV